MAKITFEQISSYLEKLRDIYISIDEGKFNKDLKELNQAISLLNSIQNGTIDPLGSTETKGKTHKEEIDKNLMISKPTMKLNKFEEAVHLLAQEKYEDLKGTKLNYREITNESDVIQLVEELTDSQVLRHTTTLDLKLLYCILTQDKKEIKAKKKEDLLQTIKQNIRAVRRGEAFTQTI
ncbi:hypothetical protein JOC85_002932 [Bacillus mesophilus]|uniref:Uncharacterized protein n=1 Tax=Bacillus mesophilus TaxID=1808955 RepID=A0A6M0Q830_9BACI|nr:hypothetical protein [Bacillus mesophilus]MBM7662125.1 hypothetical protein [Bacillus mesophilus]NEY72522.1 hypothetical protein [Bacillus mesophilus]